MASFNPWNSGPYHPFQGAMYMGASGYPMGAAPPGYGAYGANAYTDAFSGRPPVTQSQSTKFPTLNPILAADTTLLRFNVKTKPRQEILGSTWYSSHASAAKSTPCFHMRLISKAFPWTIDIYSAANVNITCEDVWNAIWGGLQEPIVDSEWGFIIKDKKLKESIEAAVKKRLEADPQGDKRPKRIDYLGDVTLFKGLEKDEEYEKLRALPYAPTVAETWLVKLTS